MRKKALLSVIALMSAVYAGYVPAVGAKAAEQMQMPEVAGLDVVKNEKAEIDISNAGDGYFMIRSLEGAGGQFKVIAKCPSGASYTYSLKSDGAYETFPFSDGSGGYSIGVYEQVEGTKYATVITADADVRLSSEFAPFIHPNQFVNYTAGNNTVKKADELTGGEAELMDKITLIYNYVLENIDYDKELAANVKSGYLPDVDAVLEKGTGICFDYAAVMAAMLRSQNIPTKLVVGYAGEIYHAWINVYSASDGWVNGVIQFNGETWTLMDPTFADTGNQSDEVMKYIGDGKNYTAKYLY